MPLKYAFNSTIAGTTFSVIVAAGLHNENSHILTIIAFVIVIYSLSFGIAFLSYNDDRENNDKDF